ncbi:hypothetical protein ABK040_002692 [Willaertia magna]
MSIFTTRLCKSIGIKYPIIQAPMGGGFTTVEMVLSVSRAGGLGSLAAAYLKPNEMREQVKFLKSFHLPFIVNLFSNIQEMKNNLRNVNKKEMLEMLKFIENLRLKYLNQVVDQSLQNTLQQVNLEEKMNEILMESEQFIKDMEEKIEILLEEKVPFIGTAFGLLTNQQIKTAHERGIKVVAMITTVDEALLAKQKGCDIIIVQGSDAGAHRSTFHCERKACPSEIGTFSLVPQVVQALKKEEEHDLLLMDKKGSKVNRKEGNKGSCDSIPIVIASGGIMDGNGLLASLMLGADGVQLGTRFITCKESGISKTHKVRLHSAKEEDIITTNTFTGRYAKGLKNQFIREMNEKQQLDKMFLPLAFPIQHFITKEMRRESGKKGNSEFMNLWSGQGIRLLPKEEESASDIIYTIMREAERVLEEKLGKEWMIV